MVHLQYGLVSPRQVCGTGAVYKARKGIRSFALALALAHAMGMAYGFMKTKKAAPRRRVAAAAHCTVHAVRCGHVAENIL